MIKWQREEYGGKLKGYWVHKVVKREPHPNGYPSLFQATLFCGHKKDAFLNSNHHWAKCRKCDRGGKWWRTYF